MERNSDFRDSKLCQEYTPITYMNTEQISPKHHLLPSDYRLKENKNRRQLIQKIRQRQKQQIIKKRKQKQGNIQRLLQEKQIAKQNAKILFDNYRKTTNKFQYDQSPIKQEFIDDKIEDCRLRATQYKSFKKNKLKNIHQANELRVKSKLEQIQAANNQRINACHLQQWRKYQNKLKKKYNKENIRNPKHLYDAFLKRQNEVKQIINKYKKTDQDKLKVSLQQKGSILETEKSKSNKNIACTSNVSKTQKNPILIHSNISNFGLSKSMVNPQKILNGMQIFLQQNKMSSEPENQQVLLLKFQQFLNKDALL